MNLSDIGSWSSIIGLAITIFTFFLAAKVNKKVNGILKSKTDKSFFQKKVKQILIDLKKMKDFAEEGNTELVYSTTQYSKINTAIEVVNSSWDALLPYDNKLSKKVKIMSWKLRFKKIIKMYSKQDEKNTNDIIGFLNKFITFLEKESCGNE